MRLKTTGWSVLTTMVAASSAAWATVASPVLDPAEGDSPVVFPVTISCATSGATIHYTLNGSEPTLSDPTVVSGNAITITRNVTLKAKAWSSSETSATTTAVYNLTGDVAAGSHHVLSLSSTGAIKAWGEQASGRLGNGLLTAGDVTSPTASKYSSNSPITDALAIAAGQNHSVFIKKVTGTPGVTNEVWAFGNNGSGELGDNTTTNREYAVHVFKSTGGGDFLRNCSMVRAGENFSAALKFDGKVYTWGSQGGGRLGNGSTLGTQKYAGTVRTAAFGNPDLTDIVSISLGSTFGLARQKVDAAANMPGYVWSWGQGGAGRLGQGNTNNQDFANKVLMPDSTPLIDAWDVSAGGSHGVVVRRNNSGVNGTVWTFGDATSGRLGNNDSTNNKLFAVQVKKTTTGGLVNLEEIQMVAAGSAHTLALDDSGKVWAWGYNGNGALGNTTAAYSTSAAFAVPVMAPSPSTAQLGDPTATGKIVWISAGGDGNNNTSYAISDKGVIYAWGRNDDGEMANGSNTGSVSRPTAISNLRVIPNYPEVSLAYNVTSSTAPGEVTLTATPTDLDGASDIKRVEFYSQGASVGTKTASPWVLNLNTLAAGNYHIYAVVTDQGDNQGYSSPVTFTIASANPNADDDGDGLTTAQETTIGTDPNDPDSDLDGADGMEDGYEQYYGLAPLSKLDGQTGSLGPNDDKDGDGMNNKDECDRGRIPTSATESPAITGTFPSSFAKWFGVDGVTYHFEYSSDQTNWTRYSTPLTGANAELSLQISTVVGASLPSPFYTRLVTVSDAPEVSLGAMVTSVAVPGAATLTATPTDPDGAADVASVEFFLDGISQGTVSYPGPWTWPLTSLAVGNHSVYAIVKDQQGKRGFSANVGIETLLVDPNADTDNDQLGDAWEIEHFGDLTHGSSEDYESDNMSNLKEFQNGTDPTLSDTDDDGVWDLVEIDSGSDPRDPAKLPFKLSDHFGGAIDPDAQPMGNLGVSFDTGGEYMLDLRLSDNVQISNGFQNPPHAYKTEQEAWRVWIDDNRFIDTVPYATQTGPYSWDPGYHTPNEITTVDGSKIYALRVEHLGVKGIADPAYADDPSADYEHSLFFMANGFLLLSSDPSIPVGDRINRFSGDPVGYDWQTHRTYAVPFVQSSYSESYTGGDATGPRFRKISLLGRPMPDSPPEGESETDVEAENSYVDAFDLSLHHDTSFASIPLAASDLRLEATASVKESSWSNRSGLTPEEDITSPFGICWSSNLCSYIEVVETLGSSSTRPTTVQVVDEGGRPLRFGTKDMETFVPWPSTLVDKKTYLNSLERSGDDLILRKKYGNKLTYRPCSAWFMYSSDRINSGPTVIKRTYWRLEEVEDRFGAKVAYEYGTNDFTLIPETISAVGRTDQKLTIQRDVKGRRVEWIKDAEGNKTEFHYGSNTFTVPSTTIDYDYQNLERVTFPGTAGEEHYTYDIKSDQETVGSRVTYHVHANLESIQRDGYAKRQFTYEFDRSRKWYDNSIGRIAIGGDPSVLDANTRERVEGYVDEVNKTLLGSALMRTQYGVPRRVLKVEWPTLGIDAHFAKTSTTASSFGPTFSAVNGTEVTDASEKKYTYSFGGVNGQIIDTDSTTAGNTGSISMEWLVYYTSMTLNYLGEGTTPIGSETYEFHPASGLSLKKSTDFSGNVTEWTYDEGRPASPQLSLDSEPEFLSVWADPTTKTDALGRLESYVYGNHRILTESTDVHGIKTTFTVDTMGRRTGMVVKNALDQTLSEESYAYGYSNPLVSPYFPGFMSKKTRKEFGSSDPSWVESLVVDYVPDSYGRVASEIVDPGTTGHKNLTTVYTYNKNNQRLTSRDPKLNTTSFEYDAVGRLVKTTFADATFKQFSYDASNAKVKEVDENGVATFLERDGLGRVVKVARDLNKSGTLNAGDIVTATEYNKIGLVTKVVNPRGYATVTTYDDLHRPDHVYGGVPEAQTGGNLASLAATSREITHDEMFYNVASNTGGGLSAPFRPTQIDHHGAVSMDRDSTDVKLTDYLVYDEVYRQVSASKQYQSGGVSRTETTAYGIGDTNTSDGKEPLVSETTLVSNSPTDRPHMVTRTTLDGLGRVVEVVNGVGLAANLVNTTTTYYTSTGLAWKVIDPLNRVTETEYDLVGRPVKVWQPDPITGLITANSPMTQSVYDANGNVTAVIDPLLNTTEFDFDVRNRNWRKRAPSVTDATDPTAPVTSVPTTTTTFDAVGNAIAVTDARNSTIRTFYDAANRPVKIRSNPVNGNPSPDIGDPDPDDITTVTELDDGGLATAVTDGNNNITRNAYDGLGRLISTITDPSDGVPVDPGASGFNATTYRNSNPTGILVTTKYDDAGNIIEVVDGAGQVTAFTYDGLARKTSTIRDPDATLERIEVSVFNEFYQTSRVDAAGRKTLYLYDGRQRLLDVVYAPVGSATTSTHTDNRHFTYDKVGKVTAVEYPNDSNTIRDTASSYDKLDRLISETSGGVTHEYTSYDKAGNRLVTTYGRTGTTLVSTYDALNRLATCDERASAGATSGQVTSYSYELGGKVSVKSLPDGLVTHTTYDKLGRTLKIRDLKSGTQLSETTYSLAAGTWPSGYDAIGNVLRFKTTTQGGATDRDVSNVYDHAYRLTTETVDPASGPDVVTSYGYSLANNRTSKTVGSATTSYVYGNGANGGNSNQLLSYGPSGQTPTHEFSYDANGNRATKVTSAGTQSHVWDFENRLTSVTLPSGTYAGTHSYVYDHRGRRVVRNESLGGGAETRLTYSGGTSVQEANTSGTVQTELIRGSDWGGGVGGLLYSIRGGQRSYNSYDSRGDVVAVTNASGARTWQAAYEAFGTRTVETGTNAERQRANTKEEDPTGLLNEGLRYRDLEAGIFISRDPAGFVDGPNDYTYVRQNPWTKFDPLGLNEVIISGGINPDLVKDKTHDLHWGNFVRSAETKIGESKKTLKADEVIEWHAQKSSLIDRAKNEGLAPDHYTKMVEDIAGQAKVELRWFDTTENFVSAINSAPNGSARKGSSLISAFTYYGHGDNGGLWLTYEPGRRPGEVLDKSDVSFPLNMMAKLPVLAARRLLPSAFRSDAKCVSWACNSGSSDDPFINSWKKGMGLNMSGIVGTADYAPSHPEFKYSRPGSNTYHMGSMGQYYGMNRTEVVDPPNHPVLGLRDTGPSWCPTLTSEPSYWRVSE